MCKDKKINSELEGNEKIAEVFDQRILELRKKILKCKIDNMATGSLKNTFQEILETAVSDTNIRNLEEAFRLL